MKLAVTGATGFVGRHVVPELLRRGHSVVAVARDTKQAELFSWFREVRFIACDLHKPIEEPFTLLGCPDAVIHLAWHGLPNYKHLFHLETNLFSDYGFLSSLVRGGLKQLLVTGTCLEYGMQSGCLREDMVTRPTNPYGLAKDTLRKMLEALSVNQAYVLQWLRLFYIYGPGQNENSLLAQLDRAIDDRKDVFDMSGGEQLRDYLQVEEVARRIAIVVEHTECNGVINCCSGTPISIRKLVEQRLVQRGAKIRLNLGRYAYPDYEPMAFWGGNEKLSKLLACTDRV